MKRYFFPLFIICFFAAEICSAQVIYVKPRPGYGNRHRRPQPQRYTPPARKAVKFEPSVNISVGYGFPNLDKESLVEFSNLRKGNVSQTGPFTGAIDYRFSRSMSIGLLVTHGKVSTGYYDFVGAESVKGSLDNWSFMLNLVRYIPVPNSVVTPYIRTAIGLNNWKQDYITASGTKLTYIDKPDEFAYQAGLGANIRLSKNAGIFVEAGYGKYILQGGLTLKF